MTAIYMDIEGSLWKKDGVRLEKQINGKRVMPSDIESARMELIVKEIFLVEGLAFTGLHNNLIKFGAENRNAISEQFQLCSTGLFHASLFYGCRILHQRTAIGVIISYI